MNSWSFQAHPLQTAVWRIFLVWTGVGALVLPFGLQPEMLARWATTAGWVDGARTLLAYADLVWMVLAALVVYLQEAAGEGLARARVAGGIVLLGSAVAEWVGATTGFPFGPYQYTDAFGPRMLGVLPIAIPLAWLVILLAARQVLVGQWPELSRGALALGVGGVALLTDFNLEFVAWKIRGYWLWYPGQSAPPSWPPWQNYFSWFALATLLTALLPRPRPPQLSIRRPLGVLLAMNALFVLAHLVRWLR